MNELSVNDLKNLIKSVFSPKSDDKKMAIIVDVPDDKVADHKNWQQRRQLAADWYTKLNSIKNDLNFDEVDLVYYPNVYSNNADLPLTAYTTDISPGEINKSVLISNGTEIDFMELLSQTQILLAPTQFSATAPLKLMAKKYGFRAATMPGFSAEMVPALKLDYEEINRRVLEIKKLLDPAVALDIHFSTTDKKSYDIHFDLTHRTAHASGGRFPDTGVAGNLPSGECYIVPYEGEKAEQSESNGILPVQFEDEIVLYQIEKNVAVKILSSGKFSQAESDKIKTEPAYANIAELGFGVLSDFGVKPSGEILLDEKLGLHIAFGRSDHFGGNVGVADFSSPEKVVHIDRIYIPETQNKITADFVVLTNPDGSKFTLMEKGEYLIF